MPLLIELFLQLNYVGYNSTLSEKLLNNDKMKENYAFFYVLIISIIYASLCTLIYSSLSTKFYKLIEPESKSKNEIQSNKFKQRPFYFLCLLYLLILFTGLNIVFSFIDYFREKPKFDIGAIVIFKAYDLQMLSFYDFLTMKIV